MNWLQVLLDNLRHLWPWWWIGTGEEGVFYRGGVAIGVRGPGIHFALWWRDQIKIEKVNAISLNLPAQSETTSDLVEITYSANIVYSITNLLKKQTKVTDFHASIENLAMIFLARKIRRLSYEALLSSRDVIELELQKALRKYASAWGVKIHIVGITDFSRAKVWRHTGDVIVH